jgi:hypothetical protein
MEGIRSCPGCPFCSDDWPMRERNQTLVGREKALFPRSKNEGAATNIFIFVKFYYCKSNSPTQHSVKSRLLSPSYLPRQISAYFREFIILALTLFLQYLDCEEPKSMEPVLQFSVVWEGFSSVMTFRDLCTIA